MVGGLWTYANSRRAADNEIKEYATPLFNVAETATQGDWQTEETTLSAEPDEDIDSTEAAGE
jgi:hypothetical protein